MLQNSLHSANADRGPKIVTVGDASPTGATVKYKN